MENEWLNIGEEPATTQVKEETVHSWRARGAEVPPIIISVIPTDQVHLNQLAPHQGTTMEE